MKLGLGMMAILFFTMSWNNFLWPLIVLSKTELYTRNGRKVQIPTFARRTDDAHQ